MIVIVFFTGDWDHWRNHVPDFQYPDTAVVDFASMLVPNVDSVRTEFLLHTIAKQGRVKIALSLINSPLYNNLIF